MLLSNGMIFRPVVASLALVAIAALLISLLAASSVQAQVAATGFAGQLTQQAAAATGIPGLSAAAPYVNGLESMIQMGMANMPQQMQPQMQQQQQYPMPQQQQQTAPLAYPQQQQQQYVPATTPLQQIYPQTQTPYPQAYPQQQYQQQIVADMSAYPQQMQFGSVSTQPQQQYAQPQPQQYTQPQQQYIPSSATTTPMQVAAPESSIIGQHMPQARYAQPQPIFAQQQPAPAPWMQQAPPPQQQQQYQQQQAPPQQPPWMAQQQGVAGAPQQQPQGAPPGAPPPQGQAQAQGQPQGQAPPPWAQSGAQQPQQRSPIDQLMAGPTGAGFFGAGAPSVATSASGVNSVGNVGRGGSTAPLSSANAADLSTPPKPRPTSCGESDYECAFYRDCYPCYGDHSLGYCPGCLNLLNCGSDQACQISKAAPVCKELAAAGVAASPPCKLLLGQGK